MYTFGIFSQEFTKKNVAYNNIYCYKIFQPVIGLVGYNNNNNKSI